MRLFRDSTLARLGACLVVGVAAGVGLALAGRAPVAPLSAWMVTALLFVVWTFLVLWPMDGDETRSHSQREDPSHGITEIVLVVASLASLAGVGVLLFGSKGGDAGAVVDALVAVGSVAASWLMVQTLYTVRYAKEFYAREDETIIDFNEDDGYEPQYSDFAYVAFDMGTTYQISDTSIHTADLRKHVMRHGLLSYVFGTVIVASALNLVVSLAGG